MRRCIALVIAVACAAAPAPPAPAAASPADESLPMTFAGLTLDAAERDGVNASPDVAAARARVDEARAAFAAAQWSIAPSGFASFSESPQTGGALTTVAAHQTAIGIQTSLAELLGYSPAVRQAAAALSSAAADEAAAERTERVGAAKVFFAALRASAVLAAREDALALAHAELNAAKTRYASGDAPHVDVIRAEVAVARAEADAETARADDANARDALQVETGTSDAALGATAPGALPLPPPLAGDPEGAVAAALQLRPEVIAAQRAADAAAA